MTRLLLAVFLLLPAVLLAQDTTTCSQLAIDLDGDLQLGAGDILMLLGGYGTDLDVDGDMIPDCQDDCVGAYDTCGVCNGPGPQVLAIDTIIITYDSIYADAIDDWLIFELDRDTLLHLVCENPGCTDPLADNFDPYAQVGGLCTYGGPCQGPNFDGYSYSAVLIGDQCWLAENLRTTLYANGDLIPAGLTGGEWSSTTSGATAVYGEGNSDCSEGVPSIDMCDEVESLAAYGRLYNWYAVDDTRGLCPSGWHVPTDGEWTELEDYITSQGLAGTEGAALKSTYGWNEQLIGSNGTDDFGFSAFPGGVRVQSDGDFAAAGYNGNWWSSSTILGNAWYRYLDFIALGVLRNDVNPRQGYSVRCLRDAE